MDETTRAAINAFDDADIEAGAALPHIENAAEDLGTIRRRTAELPSETGLFAHRLDDAADETRRSATRLGTAAETIAGVNLGAVTRQVSVGVDAVANAEAHARAAITKAGLSPELHDALVEVLEACDGIGRALRTVGEPLRRVEQMLSSETETLDQIRISVARSAGGLEEAAASAGVASGRAAEVNQNVIDAQRRLVNAVAGTREGRDRLHQASARAQQGGAALT